MEETPNPVLAEIGDITETWKHGRPFRYTALMEIENTIEDYFTECQATGERPSVIGLALALYIGYKQLCRWEACLIGETDTEAVKAFKRGLRDITIRAKLRCARAWVPNLEDRDKSRGAEFMLRVMGFSDKSPEIPAGATVNMTQNILVTGDSPALGELFAGLLPGAVVKSLAKPAEPG